MLKCRICQNEQGNELVHLTGTMYGTRGNFDYFLCAECGCLQIVEEPQNLSEFYDNSRYYSFNMDRRKIRNDLLYSQMKHQLKGHSILGALVQWIYPVDYRYLSLVSYEDHILDVGCGDGELIRWMIRAGYQNVLGIDPFLSDNVTYQGKVIALKGDISEYQFDKNQKFRMVTMIHSFEHVYNQREVLQGIDNILENDGYLVIQLPGLSKYYWKKYGKCLYTLDPPRHQYIHTKSSLDVLMREMNYELVSYGTEIDVAIPKMAENLKKDQVEKNQGTSFVSGTIVSLLSKPLRRRLKREDDGAIITAVYQKKHDTDVKQKGQ